MLLTAVTIVTLVKASPVNQHNMQAQLKQELQQELTDILAYWMEHAADMEKGGYYGKIMNDNTIDPFALKGAVLQARILWTFSAAYNVTRSEAYLAAATHAFDFITTCLLDKEFGGVMWAVDYAGNPVDTQKQVYAIAFTVYALAEYYKATANKDALERAKGLYSLIQLYAYDCVYGGYTEGFTRDWKEHKDHKVNNRETGEKKSLSTHLHILEAYTNLYTIWPDESLKTHIRDLLKVFKDKILRKDSYHLQLFFDEQWNASGAAVSFGHDIEAAWLMQEAAEVIGDETLTGTFRELAVKMADVTYEGLDKDGGIWFQYDPAGKQYVMEKRWWPQAEALVGFVNAWQVSGDEEYLLQARRTWEFIKTHIVDKDNGEWYWGVDSAYNKMDEDKVGLWKSPYHNGRACLEVMKRL